GGDVALDVVDSACDDQVCVGAPVAGDRGHSAAEGVDLDAGRGIPVCRVPGGPFPVGAPGIVVGVVGVGLPRRGPEPVGLVQSLRNAEDDDGHTAVRVERADQPAARIVEHHHLLPELGVQWRRIDVAGCVERLVLLYYAALVVIGLPSGDHHVV